jgi:hypothetical protein
LQSKLTAAQGSSQESKEGSVEGKEEEGSHNSEGCKIKEEPTVKRELTEEETEVSNLLFFIRRNQP